MISYYYQNVRDPEMKRIPEFRSGSLAYLEQPTSDELDQIAETMKLDRSLLGDAIDPFEPPRMEFEAGDLYLFTRIPSAASDPASTLPFLIVIGKEGTLVTAQEPLPFLDRLIADPSFLSTQKSKAFIKITGEIIALYRKVLTDISKSVRYLTRNVHDVDVRDISLFVAYEQTLNDFLDALVPTNLNLKRILTGKQFALFAEDEDLVEDLMLATDELLEIARASMKSITNVRNAFSTLTTNQLNRSIRMLTVLTIIVSLPTAVTGFYGMNVPIPGADDPTAFWLILGGTLLATLIAWLAFSVRRKF